MSDKTVTLTMQCSGCGEQGWNLRHPDEWDEHNASRHGGLARPALAPVSSDPDAARQPRR